MWHMVNSEENMTKLKDAEMRVTVRNSKTLTKQKRGDWHRYQRRDGKVHHVTLTNTSGIPGLHVNLFTMARALQESFQLTPEGETLILKKNSTKIRFDEKMANKSKKGFMITTKFYKSENDAAIFSTKKQKTEGKSEVHLGGIAVKKQEQTTNKQIPVWKIHANEIHANLGHPWEDRMRVTMKHLHCSIKETLEVFEDCATAKIKHKYLHKVAEERNLNPV